MNQLTNSEKYFLLGLLETGDIRGVNNQQRWVSRYGDHPTTYINALHWMRDVHEAMKAHRDQNE